MTSFLTYITEKSHLFQSGQGRCLHQEPKKGEEEQTKLTSSYPGEQEYQSHLPTGICTLFRPPVVCAQICQNKTNQTITTNKTTNQYTWRRGNSVFKNRKRIGGPLTPLYTGTGRHFSQLLEGCQSSISHRNVTSTVLWFTEDGQLPVTHLDPSSYETTWDCKNRIFYLVMVWSTLHTRNNIWKKQFPTCTLKYMHF